MSSRRREPPAGLLPRPTRLCAACGRPIPIKRFTTLELRALGWQPFQVGALRSWCGHPQLVVPHPAHGSPGWWTFIPLVGTGPSLRPPKPRPQGPGREVLLAHPAEVARIEHEHDAGLEALVIQLQAERAAITSLSDEAACRLCGTHAPLTPEHAPSRAAGNSGLVLGGRVDDDASHATGRLTWTEDEDQPDGATVETLCGPCNHRTGRQFNPSYVVFAKACESVAQPESAGTRCAVGVVNRPLVAKQALVSLIATSQPGLTSRYPHLRTLLETSQCSRSSGTASAVVPPDGQQAGLVHGARRHRQP